MEHKTIHNSSVKILDSYKEFSYQEELTTKLDNTTGNFNQGIINEIVLWKVNRYAKITDKAIDLINSIGSDIIMNEELTIKILKLLLNTKGIQLPMASTILRFKNKYVYQIIDQRVYRIICKTNPQKLNSNNSEKNINSNIDLYLNYLKDLRIVCNLLSIPFEESDRILYMADKDINKDFPLKNY
ncbi:MAG: hypothetical protein A3K10_00705 [Bacteroidetes bacterium RIFCSPLOWO2_12_FULL_31_6]|nr:MAG: hypothetical protein A3K10_00705 [Bacteroidetes bacterium RIFCSPLOWO2_12_FULL_31_6]